MMDMMMTSRSTNQMNDQLQNGFKQDLESANWRLILILAKLRYFSSYCSLSLLFYSIGVCRLN